MSDAPSIDLDFSLATKVALVTGGGSGIGQAIARALAKKGARVALLDNNLQAAEATAAELADARAFRCDVADPASVAEAVGAAEAAFGESTSW